MSGADWEFPYLALLLGKEVGRTANFPAAPRPTNDWWNTIWGVTMEHGWGNEDVGLGPGGAVNEQIDGAFR